MTIGFFELKIKNKTDIIHVSIVHITYHKIQVNENTACVLTFLLFPSVGYPFLVYTLQTQNFYIIGTHVALVMQYAPLI